jgi:hypothetical protein
MERPGVIPRGEAIDLVAHDPALRQRVVEAAEQRSLQVGACVLEEGDLRIERLEAVPRDVLPLVDARGIEDAVDVIEREARVLEHPDEYQHAKRVRSVPTLA